MRALRFPCVLLCVLLLQACASSPALDPAPAPWHDERFPVDAAFRPVSKADLFRLDPEMRLLLRRPEVRDSGSSRRLGEMLKLVFGPDHRAFGYAAGDTTTAAETWRQRRGDCLSLTILTYAAARELGLHARMQEVYVPQVYDRRDGWDYVNRHVNLVAQVLSHPHDEVLRDVDVVVDFEPEYATKQKGRTLTEDEVLAHFHNNRGAQQLAQGRHAAAYAHFKAAITAEPRFAAAWSNLAMLYREQGLLADAEQLLQRAIALGPDSANPLVLMQDLLQQQGRIAEADAYARRLEHQRESDPYHWIAKGVDALAAGEARGAARALERAQALATGFAEVHRYLAMAYLRLGERELADRQLAQLVAMDRGSRATAKLKRKFNEFSPQ